MSKEKTLYEIKDQAMTDFTRLVHLLEHGVINATCFKSSVNILCNSFITAISEERRTGGQ